MVTPPENSNWFEESTSPIGCADGGAAPNAVSAATPHRRVPIRASGFAMRMRLLTVSQLSVAADVGHWTSA
jgi:hypothetical protein